MYAGPSSFREQAYGEVEHTPLAHWQIKSVPVEIRKLAAACAARRGETMAVWVARAVRIQAMLEEAQ
jgi:hypothetical protein